MDPKTTASRRRWSIIVAAAVLLLAAIVVIGLVLSGVWGGTAGRGDADASTTGERTAGVGAGVATEPGAVPDSVAPESPGAEGPRSEGGTPDGATGLPLPSDGAVLVRRPLPPAASTIGDFAPGFPREVIGIPPGSTISSSSLASEGDRLQAGLVGMAPGTGGSVMEHYRAAFTTLGLTGREAAAAPGSTAEVFTLGENSITVTVVTRDGGVEFSVLGILLAG